MFCYKNKTKKRPNCKTKKMFLFDGFLRHHAFLPTLDGLVLCYQYERENLEVDKDLKDIYIVGQAEVVVPRCSIKNVFILQIYLKLDSDTGVFL